jgi:putative ABC transport system permease protein
MNLLKLALRMLRRDWRAGELRVLAFALVIAVGGMTTVGFFADRVQLALSRQGNQLLGADLIISPTIHFRRNTPPRRNGAG